MMPLSITGMSLVAVLGIAAAAPCRAQTFDPGFLDRTAEERSPTSRNRRADAVHALVADLVAVLQPDDGKAAS